MRNNPDLNGGTWVATDASELPSVPVTTHGDYLYWADVVYDGSVGPFVDPTLRLSLPRSAAPDAVVGAVPPAAPISNETVHAFYEIAGSGTPWNLTGGVHRTFCADGTCDEACDGSSDNCAWAAASWCDTPASPCVVTRGGLGEPGFDQPRQKRVRFEEG